MATSFQIPTVVIDQIKTQFPNLDINQWIADKGFTVTKRDRNNDRWIITVSEDLTAGQKTTFEGIVATAAQEYVKWV